MNTIIEKIRAEVNRLMRENSSSSGLEGGVLDLTYEDGINTALNDVLEILDTLQEQPVCEDLEDMADTLAEEHGFVKKPNFKPAKYSWSAVRDVFIEGVIAGASWQKEQMMMSAVDAEVKSYVGGDGLYVEVDLTGTAKFNAGQKVKAIFEKEDEK